MLAGGYSPAPVDDTAVVNAALWAVQYLPRAHPDYSFYYSNYEDQFRIVVVRAAQQVVAGMNYKLTLALVNGDGQCEGAFKCTVYNHFGELSLTEWGEELSCEEVAELMKEDSDPEE
jgi:Cystatin domain